MTAAPIRPWSNTGVRCAMELGTLHSANGSPHSYLGWVLLRLGPDAITSGELLVPSIETDSTGRLGPAEYRTLREDCGLSLREVAAWNDVKERTVSYWEAPNKGGPSVGAASDLARLRAQMTASAQQSAETAERLLAAHQTSGPVELIRYTPQDYPLSQPAAEGLPHGAHNRLLSLTADALAARGISVEIVYRGAGRMYPSTDPEAGGWEATPPDFIK